MVLHWGHSDHLGGKDQECKSSSIWILLVEELRVLNWQQRGRINFVESFWAACGPN